MTEKEIIEGEEKRIAYLKRELAISEKRLASARKKTGLRIDPVIAAFCDAAKNEAMTVIPDPVRYTLMRALIGWATEAAWTGYISTKEQMEYLVDACRGLLDEQKQKVLIILNKIKKAHQKLIDDRNADAMTVAGYDYYSREFFDHRFPEMVKQLEEALENECQNT